MFPCSSGFSFQSDLHVSYSIKYYLLQKKEEKKENGSDINNLNKGERMINIYLFFLKYLHIKVSYSNYALNEKNQSYCLYIFIQSQQRLDKWRKGGKEQLEPEYNVTVALN